MTISPDHQDTVRLNYGLSLSPYDVMDINLDISRITSGYFNFILEMSTYTSEVSFNDVIHFGQLISQGQFPRSGLFIGSIYLIIFT